MPGAGGGGGQGGMPDTGTPAAIDCNPCSGQPVDHNGCDNSGNTFLVFASCIMAATPGPTLTLQFVITPTPADCPLGGDGTKDLVVANQCDLVVRHIDGTEVTVDWAPFLGGTGGECFQNPDCPGHGAERYGANWRDVPELAAPPFNGMDGTCEDVVRVAVCGATGDEITSCAGVRSPLNRLSLSGESAPERPRIDRLAERFPGHQPPR